MIRTVFDTNVLISAFAVPGSRSEKAFLLAMRGRVDLISSAAILTETANKLRQKFGLPEEDIIAVLKHVSRTAEIVKPTTRLAVLADEPDNRILECATTAEVDLIVTGDKHLLSLKSYEGIGTCRVADLLRTVGEGEPGRSAVPGAAIKSPPPRVRRPRRAAHQAPSPPWSLPGGRSTSGRAFP